MSQLRSIIRKEFLLLSRDIHGLLLLFIMPVVFILIMSLAMQDDFSSRAGGKIEVLLSYAAADTATKRFVEIVGESAVFQLVDQSAESENTLNTWLNQDQYKFLLKIDKQFTEQLLTESSNDSDDSAVTVTVAPSTSRQMEMIFQSIVLEAVARVRLENMLNELQQAMPDVNVEKMADQVTTSKILSVQYSDKKRSSETPPSSVQQSVPAWLVFSLFFVVVPLSNTLINERQYGTLKRLRTINVNPLAIVVGKLTPYFLVNQLQVGLMLLVGVYLVPVLGGDSLTLGNSPLGLMLVGVGISCGSLGYAMLIAVIARTAEQATTLGGTGNIILAAIGGIMVPTFIMPEFMQSLSQLSPMSWGLQGFLDILLRGGGVEDVLKEVLTLVLFGAVCLAMAAVIFTKHNRAS
jgi:ABC-2 type transport system permease protein